MSKSRRSSNASACCHLEWRPSRQVGACLLALALLAPFSLMASDVPTRWGVPFALLALTIGVRDWRRYRRQLPMDLRIPAGRGQATAEGRPVQGLRVAWRGPLCFLRWRDGGRRERRVFWPDTLDAAGRRELKLALQRRESARVGATMAG